MPYCDHNATAPLRPLSRDAVAHALTITGNPSSVHAHGRAARAVVEKARDLVAKLVGAKSDQVIFTSGATEANALALWGAVEGAIDRSETEKSARITRLFVSAIEHSSVLKTAQVVAERAAGVRLETLPVTAEGVLDLEALRVALREGKGRALVAVMAANNETGVVQPIDQISRLCREAGALLLVDAVTAAGKIDLDAGICDYMTLSAHKLGGPQGVGALVVREEAPLAPQMTGGGQQKGLRAGTENLSGIAGFGAAVEAVLSDTGERARIASVCDRFERALRTSLPDAVIFGEGAPRLGNTSNVALPGLSSQNIVIALDLDGVMVSAGSSCSSGKIAPSHVLSAMGVADELAGASIRVSFGWNSTQEDADAVVASLVKLASRVRARAAA
ncbi:MAG: cysteine desulfurase family protein [Pseudomonadota bacterium]